MRDANEPFSELPPKCACGALLRPDIVDAVKRADLLLVIGTSGVVYLAAGLVSLHRGLSIEINPQGQSRMHVRDSCESSRRDSADRRRDPGVRPLVLQFFHETQSGPGTSLRLVEKLQH